MSHPIHLYITELDLKVPTVPKYNKRRIFRKSKLLRVPPPPKQEIGNGRKTAEILYEFLENSSIHGLGQLVKRDQHISEYILWIAVLAAAVMGTIYIGQKSWKRYQYFPTVISMEKDYMNWNTTFATATVCPEIKTEESVLRKLADKYKVKDADGFVEYFRRLGDASYENFDNLPEYEEVSPDDYLRIIVEAKYNFSFRQSNSQDISQNLTLMVMENNLCYGFNAEVGLYFSTENFGKKLPIKRNNNNLIRGSPLDGEVFVQVMNMSSGYKISLTGPYDIPDVSVRRFVSELKYYLLLDLTALSIISSDNIRGLSPNQRKCRFFDESDLDISDIYAYNICRMECRANLAYKLCKCIPYFYRNSKGRSYCNASGLKCLGKHDKYLTYLREPKSNERVPCGCLPLCNDVHYLVEQETHLEWSKATNLKFSMVHYPRMRLKREIIFGFADLLVSIGGTAGFFLGCSVLSFIEILYFVTLRLFFSVAGAVRNRKTITAIRYGESYSRMDESTRIYFPAVGAMVPPRSKLTVPRERAVKNRQRFWKHARMFLDEFLENSSIHGLGHLTARNKHLSEYLIWILALLAAVAGMSYMGLKAWKRYQYYPTVLSMEKDYKNWNTSFSMSTICPDARTDSGNLRRLAEKRGVKGADMFVRFFEKLSRASYTDMDELPDYDEVHPKDYIRILQEARFNFTFSLSNTKGVQQVPILTITENGLCYTINTELGVYFTPRNFNRKLPVRRGNYGLINGNPLDGEVFIQAMNLNSGYNISITGPFDVSDVSTKKSSSELWRYLVLEVTVLPIISSPGLRSLSPAQRKCRFFDESDLEISDIYSYNLCRMQCRARLAFKLCNCLPYFYKNPKQRPYCNASGMKCLGKHGRYLSDLRDPETDQKLKCDCLPLCNDFHYLVAQETLIPWPDHTHLKNSMTDFPRTRLKREVIFGFDDFLVSLGGTAGLLLGCSVLSFIEITYFFTLRLYFFLRDNKRRRQIRRPHRGRWLAQNKSHTYYI